MQKSSYCQTAAVVSLRRLQKIEWYRGVGQHINAQQIYSISEDKKKNGFSSSLHWPDRFCKGVGFFITSQSCNLVKSLKVAYILFPSL